MRKFVALGTLAALALGAQSAAAEGFSYNLIEGSYAFADFDGTDADGFGIKGSWELAPTIHVFGGLQNLDVEGPGGSFDTLNLGVAMNWGLTDTVDLIGAVSYERVDSGSAESGFGVGVGLRGLVGESFELNGSVKYADIGDVGDGISFTAGARYYFTPNFAAGVDFNKLDFDSGDADQWVIALRYDFGDR